MNQEHNYQATPAHPPPSTGAAQSVPSPTAGRAREGLVVTQEQAEQPIINLHGELVALGLRHRDHMPLFLRWISDFAVTRTYGMRFRNRTWEAMQSGYEQGSKGGSDYVDFTIYERATLRPIGWTALEEIDHFDRTAKYIILIGEQSCWGKGYGTETTRLMLDYGFTGLGLHNIYLTVFSFNERGYRAYRCAGFQELGRRREAHRLGGRAYDVIYMDCLATEFVSPVLYTLLPGSQQRAAVEVERLRDCCL